MRRWIGAFGLLAAVALAGCSSDLEARNDQLSRENADLVTQLDEARTRTAQEIARSEALNGQVSGMDRENKKLLAERNQAAQAAQAHKEEADRLRAMASAAPAPAAAPSAADSRGRAEEIAGTLSREGFDAKVNANGDVEILLSGDVTFGSGMDTLSESGKKSLRALAPKLSGKFAPYMIRVEGHTDNVPLKVTKAKYGDNLGLSTARANSVTRFLQDEMRIDAGRLMSAGRGEQKPIADNTTEKGRARNRRVEIVVFIPRESVAAEAK